MERIAAYKVELLRVKSLTLGVYDKLNKTVAEHKKAEQLYWDEHNKKVEELKRLQQLLAEEEDKKHVEFSSKLGKQVADIVEQDKLRLAAKKFIRQSVLDEIAKIDEEMDQSVFELSDECARFIAKRKDLTDQLNAVREQQKVVETEWTELSALFTS